MKNVNLIAMHGVAVLLITIAGCSPTARTQTPAEVKPDPVSALKEIIGPIEMNGKKYGYVASDITYDVKKTDSLVSPYTAVVNFRSRNMTGQRPVEKDFQFHMITTLTHQDGKWVIKDVERHLDPMSESQRMEQDMLRTAGTSIPDVERHSDGTNDKEINAWWRAFGGN